jgi:hypothetical protein
LLTLDARPRWSTATVTLTSHNPRTIQVRVKCGEEHALTRVAPGETRAVTVRLPAGPRRLEVVSPVFCPKALGLGDDGRRLGVLVGEVRYG